MLDPWSTATKDDTTQPIAPSEIGAESAYKNSVQVYSRRCLSSFIRSTSANEREATMSLANDAESPSPMFKFSRFKFSTSSSKAEYLEYSSLPLL